MIVPAMFSAVALLLGGAVCCFAGYRFFRVSLGILGFCAGGAIAFSLLRVFGDWSLLPSMVGGLLGGVLGSISAMSLYFFGVFLVGLFLGLLVGYQVALQTAFEPPLPMILLGIGGGVLAIALQRSILIIATALTGAWLMMLGLSSFLFHQPPWWNLQRFPFIGDRGNLLLLIWLALFLGGVLVQFLSDRRAKKRGEAPEGQ